MNCCEIVTDGGNASRRYCPSDRLTSSDLAWGYIWVAALAEFLLHPYVMSKYRSFLAAALAVVMVLFVTFVSPAEAKSKSRAQVYTADQITEIQGYAGEVNMMRDRITTDLKALVDKEDWVFTRNFIHGPLGELRLKMLTIARDLFPDAQAKARDLAKDAFTALANLDKAAADKDSRALSRSFKDLVKSLNEFDALLPQ
jgi:photosystem II protein PsbQ